MSARSRATRTASRTPRAACASTRCPRAVGPAGCDPAFAREQWLDPYDIDAAVLIPVQSGVVIPWGDERASTEFISAFNDHLLDDWHGLDSRYRVTISITPHDPAAAIREVERLADVEGVVAIFVPHASISLGRRQWWPLYELAAERGLPDRRAPDRRRVEPRRGPLGRRRAAAQLPGASLAAAPPRAEHARRASSSPASSTRSPELTVVLSEYGFSWVPSVTMRMDDAWEKGDRELAGHRARTERLSSATTSGSRRSRSTSPPTGATSGGCST